MTTDTIINILIGLVALIVIAGFGFRAVCARFRHEFTIWEGYTGLLYHHGKLAGTLATGRHARWGRGFHLVQHDTRRTLQNVPGQEVLTADNIAVKLSLVLTTQLVDAVLAVTSSDKFTEHIYSAAQTALRSVIAATTLEALLASRAAIGTQLRELLAPQTAAVGVTLHAVEVRDVMLPGELRKAFADVIKTRHEGQAALERVRTETAALRNLANAARLVAEQPALATLRFLQSLEASKSQTVVMNDLSAFTKFAVERSGESKGD